MPKPKAQKKSSTQPAISGQSAARTSSTSTIAHNTVMRQPTYLRFDRGVEDGLRISGRQLLTNVTTTATDEQLFSTNGATLASANQVLISPDALNGRVALLARNFARYIFRRVQIHYVSRVPTTQAGGGVFALIEDGAVGAFSTLSYATVCSASRSTLFTFREDRSLDTGNCDLEPLYTEIDSANAAGYRQTAQYQLVGFPDASSIGAVNQGHIWIEYVLDLMVPSNDYGFTISVDSPIVKSFLRNLAKSVLLARSTDPGYQPGLEDMRRTLMLMASK